MDELIKDIIYSSIKNLFQNQPDIFVNTRYTNFTEWNLSYHLSNEIAKYIFWLNVDLDVTKRNYNNRRPDIIFHKRRTNSLNYLVVELKKSKKDNQSDICKLKEDWMREPLNYRYGAYINIWGKDNFKAIVLINGEGQEVNDSCQYIPVPSPSKILLTEYKIFTSNIIQKKMKANLLDNLILETYERRSLNYKK
ncbi:hypothetical protein [Metabacillus sediminilitoris]|uniref:Type I restriction enzyme R protein N-terminal domain-containing protein n=1 Tax=Metabacillus sediminilitoris TaxID=2567941 RepID=A0A4S4BUW6_9BACI|nr:hypothetical protein [Metabacillus sediminilitoris]QGQ44756.1 hypothetical protein GMB29_05410 [Metabacillus sediminilitoris]THF78896.1 hypothetical protein E6W99_14300 [Metabacillus sediminilitoris]